MMKTRTDRRYASQWRILLAVGAITLSGCGGYPRHDLDFGTGVTASPTPSPAPSVAAGDLIAPFAGKVAFVSRRGAEERDQLYVMNPDGSQVTQLHPLSNLSSLNLKYPGNHFMNANGTKFLFTVDEGTGSGTGNFLVNADGSNQRNITALLDPAATGSGDSTIGRVTEVAMNADGSQLVFPYSASPDAGGNAATLVTLNADGSARTTRYTAPTGQGIQSPIFAPDGQTIYFVQGTSGSESPFPFAGSIYRLAPGASTPTAVTAISVRGAGNNTLFPQISINNDGTKLAYGNYVDGSSNEIFTVRTDGTGVTRLTTDAASDTNAAFTTDGAKILFESYRDGNAELYSMNPDGSAVTRLTYNIEMDSEPATRAKTATKTARPQGTQKGAL